MTTLEELVVDHFSYYADPDLTEPDMEIWIKDAETGDVVLCADSNLGMGKVETEAIVYGNLSANFRRMLGTVGYQGKLFRVYVYHNGTESCVRDDSDEDDELVGKSAEDLLGASAVVNYETLSSAPIVATNASFYLRLRPESVAANAVPQTITNTLSGDTLAIDQVALAEGINFGDSDEEPEIEIHIVDAATDGMIACSGDSEGMRPVTDGGLTYGKLLADLLDGSESLVDFDDQEGRSVKVVMIDNDGTACPEPIETEGEDNEVDDVLGESGEILWEDLPGATVEFTNGAGSVTFNYLPNF